MKYPVTRGTPSGERWGICYKCGFKYHVRDLYKIKDPYNRDFGKVVCKKHILKTNPQVRPFVVKEELLANPYIVAPRVDAGYYSNEADDRVPGKPLNGKAVMDGLNDLISLHWDAPLDQGSSPITGYIIKQSIPQTLSYDTILSSNTRTSTPYFLDEVSDPSVSCSYIIAAINDFGTGIFSDDIFFPERENYEILAGNSYLMTEPVHDFLITEDGHPIEIHTS